MARPSTRLPASQTPHKKAAQAIHRDSDIRTIYGTAKNTVSATCPSWQDLVEQNLSVMGLVQTEDLEQLAETCLTTAKAIKGFLASNGHPQMSYDQNGPSVFPHAPPDIEFARFTLREAAQRLIDLSLGPTDIIVINNYAQLQDLNAFRYVQKFDIAKAVPFNDTISYHDLAAKTGVDAGQLKQMLRQLMVRHVFQEAQPNQVGHTASSKLLTEPGIGQFNAYVALESLDHVANLVNALEKWGHGSQEPNQAALNYANNTDKYMYEFYEEPRAKETRERFSDAITYVASMDVQSTSHIVAAYDWKALGEVTLVDVGGNIGVCSVVIAQANPKIKVIVQDLPEIMQRAQHPLTCVVPEELRDRFTFMAHNFYDPQPVQADVYFLRMIMHDYPDAYCVKILKPLVAAMKPGARLMIMDQILPPVGVAPLTIERFIRAQDLQMMCLTNARERDMEQWTELLEKTDKSLRVKNVAHPPGSAMALIEVVLDEATAE